MKKTSEPIDVMIDTPDQADKIPDPKEVHNPEKLQLHYNIQIILQS